MNIKQIHLEKQNKVSDKWSSYLDYYDDIFLKYKDKSINIFEIGVQNGGSLETWAEYFKNANFIIGCDIDKNCLNLQYEDPRIKLLVSDANSEGVYNTIKKNCETIDIVIDDGSHFSVDILLSFILYFPLLSPGGTYIIEDTHTLYWDSWGGEKTNPYNANLFFKKLVDIINYQFWKDTSTIEEFFSDFFSNKPVPSFLYDGCIESIEFRNSLIVIKKSKVNTQDGLGERLITGTKTLVHHIKEQQPIQNNLFCIISAIRNEYGIFSYQQRYEQLLNTIKSIRIYAPNSDIVIFDASEDNLPEKDLIELRTLVNKIQVLHEDNYISFLKYNSKDPSPNKIEKKTIGEIQAMLAFLTFLKNFPQKYNRIFKISGRYALNENFNIEKHLLEKNKLVLHNKEDWTDNKKITPMRLWSFDYSMLEEVCNLFTTMQKHTIETVTKTGELELLEYTFTKFVKQLQIPNTEFDITGIEGLMGHTAIKINE